MPQNFHDLKDLITTIASFVGIIGFIWGAIRFAGTFAAMKEMPEKVANIDRFQNDPNCVVMIANQGAGGTGVNLTAANYDIYYSKDFSLEKDIQSNARTDRGGQKRKTTRIDIVSPGTIDLEINDALRAKRKMVKNLLDTRASSIFTDIDFKKIIT